MWRLRNIVRKINAWLFVNRIGSLSREYHNIKDPVDRFLWAQEKFRKDMPLVIQEHEIVLRIDTREAFNEN